MGCSLPVGLLCLDKNRRLDSGLRARSPSGNPAPKLERDAANRLPTSYVKCQASESCYTR